MANTTITMRIDEETKAQLQELMNGLGLDVTTFFTMAAKQAIRTRSIPFDIILNDSLYGEKAYRLARENATYNSEGKVVIPKDDEWREETEWDDMFEQMKSERGV